MYNYKIQSCYFANSEELTVPQGRNRIILLANTQNLV